jgi:hypothetical protein
VIIWYLDLQPPMQSVPITIIVVSSNTAHCKVSSIQLYVIKFVSDLRQVVSGFLRVLYTTLCDKVCQWLMAGGQWFSPGTLVSSPNKTDRHNITEILLKVIEDTLQWAVFELTTIMVIGTDCMGGCKSKYHMITTAPSKFDNLVKCWYNYSKDIAIHRFLFTCILIPLG